MAEKLGKLARRYARALYRTVAETLPGEKKPTAAQQLAGKLLDFSKLWKENKELENVLLSPMFDDHERLGALLEVGKRAGLEPLLLRFLETLFRRDRLGGLPEIAEAFAALADEKAGLVHVEVETARPLPEEEKEQIKRALHRQLRAEMDCSWRVNPSILGGMIVRFGGKILDGSVSGRLEQLERRLLA